MCLNNKSVAGAIGLVKGHLSHSHSFHYAHASSAVAVLSVNAIFVNEYFARYCSDAIKEWWDL